MLIKIMRREDMVEVMAANCTFMRWFLWVSVEDFCEPILIKKRPNWLRGTVYICYVDYYLLRISHSNESISLRSIQWNEPKSQTEDINTLFPGTSPEKIEPRAGYIFYTCYSAWAGIYSCMEQLDRNKNF